MQIRNILTGITLLVFGSCHPVSDELQHTVWKMDEGMAFIEVESVVEGMPSPGVWEEFTEVPGYSGKTAFQMASSGNEYMDPLAHDAEYTDVPYKLTYRVYVPREGRYLVRVHNYHRLKDGDNDAWIGINNDLYEKIWDHDTLVWSWNEAIAWQYGYQPRWLHQGVNTITLVGRSQGWVVDRLAIVREDIPDAEWQNIQLPESEKLIFDQQPQKPRGLKIKRVGYNYALLEWDQANNGIAYRVYLNGSLVRLTYQRQVALGGLMPDVENVVAVVAENSYGIGSESAELSFQTDATDLINIQKQSLPPDWSLLPNISTSKHTVLKAALSDSTLHLLVKTSQKQGYLNVSFDPDNSRDETFSMADRLFYSKLEAPELKERLNRYANVNGAKLTVTPLEDGTLEFMLEVPCQTLGKTFKVGDAFGLRVWMSKGEKGEEPIERILGNEYEGDNNFPYTFEEMMVVK